MREVVVDADFFRHVTEYEIGTELFEKLMSINSYKSVMHYYVSSVELKGNTKLQKVINDGKITIIKEDDFIQKGDKEYIAYFKQAYEKLNHFELGEENVWEYGYDETIYGQNLGEIRSVYLAMKKGAQVLLSDDGDTKTLCRFVSSSKVKVSSENLYDILMRHYENGSISWRDVKSTVQGLYATNDKRRDELYKRFNVNVDLKSSTVRKKTGGG